MRQEKQGLSCSAGTDKQGIANKAGNDRLLQGEHGEWDESFAGETIT